MKLIKTLIIASSVLPVAAMASSIKLVNDTGSKQSIHTGSGFVTLNKGSSTSFSCKKGKEVRKAERGSKKGVIFKIQSKHCGKTVKLSDVM